MSQLSFKLGHGWVITPHIKLWNIITYPCPTLRWIMLVKWAPDLSYSLFIPTHISGEHCMLCVYLASIAWHAVSLRTGIRKYRKTSNISCTLVDNKMVVHSDLVGASPVGAAPSTSSFSTIHLALMDWEKTTARWGEKHLSFGIWCALH